MERRIRTAQSDEVEPTLFGELTELCEAAFRIPFAEVWERVGPGLHVVAEVGGRAVAHAMIVDRPLYLEHEADVELDAAYVENVATHPEHQRQGHGAAVMAEIGRIITDEYAIGALATTSNAFYASLGWETWRGPVWARMADGQRLRNPEHEGHVMVLRTSRTPSALDLDGPIAIDWRPGTAW